MRIRRGIFFLIFPDFLRFSAIFSELRIPAELCKLSSMNNFVHLSDELSPILFGFE